MTRLASSRKKGRVPGNFGMSTLLCIRPQRCRDPSTVNPEIPFEFRLCRRGYSSVLQNFGVEPGGAVTQESTEGGALAPPAILVLNSSSLQPTATATVSASSPLGTTCRNARCHPSIDVLLHTSTLRIPGGRECGNGSKMPSAQTILESNCRRRAVLGPCRG